MARSINDVGGGGGGGRGSENCYQSCFRYRKKRYEEGGGSLKLAKQYAIIDGFLMENIRQLLFLNSLLRYEQELTVTGLAVYS